MSGDYSSPLNVSHYLTSNVESSRIFLLKAMKTIIQNIDSLKAHIRQNKTKIEIGKQ